MDAFAPMRSQREEEQLEARLQHVEDELGRVTAANTQARIAELQQTVSELLTRVSQLEAQVAAI